MTVSKQFLCRFFLTVNRENKSNIIVLTIFIFMFCPTFTLFRLSYQFPAQVPMLGIRFTLFKVSYQLNAQVIDPNGSMAQVLMLGATFFYSKCLISYLIIDKVHMYLISCLGAYAVCQFHPIQCLILPMSGFASILLGFFPSSHSYTS